MRTRRQDEDVIRRAIASGDLDDTDTWNLASVVEGLDREATYQNDVSGMLHDLGMDVRVKLQADELEKP